MLILSLALALKIQEFAPTDGMKRRGIYQEQIKQEMHCTVHTLLL
jgi:hypothetical protein